MIEERAGATFEFTVGFLGCYGHRRLPMRFMLIVVSLAVAMLLDFRVSQATQMPWCAGTTKGDFFSYNCTLPTYEMCVQPVLPRARIRVAQGQAEATIHASSVLGAMAALLENDGLAHRR